MGETSRKLLKLLTLVRRRGWRRGLTLGVAAAIEHGPALASERFATIVDIGANVGQFSLFCREAVPTARILAFEPLPEPAARFRQICPVYVGVCGPRDPNPLICPSIGSIRANIRKILPTGAEITKAGRLNSA